MRNLWDAEVEGLLPAQGQLVSELQSWECGLVLSSILDVLDSIPSSTCTQVHVCNIHALFPTVPVVQGLTVPAHDCDRRTALPAPSTARS